MSECGGPLIGIGTFSAIIGKPCSGIDSLLLFTALYSLMLILDWKRMNKAKAIAFFAIGMFITNILRIFVLFLVGAHYSPKLVVGLFHLAFSPTTFSGNHKSDNPRRSRDYLYTNLGWILFIAYFAVFWIIAQRYIYR
jgi:exosortase/archaeosortase family protein